MEFLPYLPQMGAPPLSFFAYPAASATAGLAFPHASCAVIRSPGRRHWLVPNRWMLFRSRRIPPSPYIETLRGKRNQNSDTAIDSPGVIKLVPDEARLYNLLIE